MYSNAATAVPNPYGSIPHAASAVRGPLDTLPGVAPARAPFETIRELRSLHHHGTGPRAARRRQGPPDEEALRCSSSVRFRGMTEEERVSPFIGAPPPIHTCEKELPPQGPFVSGTAPLASPWAAMRGPSRGTRFRRALMLLAAAGAGFVAVHQIALTLLN